MPAPQRDLWNEYREGAKLRMESGQILFREWLAAVREEPALIWETLTIRYTVYAVAAIMLILTVRCAVTAFQPPLPADARPAATTALFDAICSSPSCGKHFVIERNFSFDRFPVECPFCDKLSGYRALRCPSKTCRNRLVQTYEKDDTLRCVACEHIFQKH